MDWSTIMTGLLVVLLVAIVEIKIRRDNTITDEDEIWKEDFE